MLRKHGALLGVAILVFGLFLVYFLPGQTDATTGINQEMSFEGKIVNSSGLNIADNSYNMEFNVYTGCTNEPTNNTGCTSVWTEDWLVHNAQAVPFTSGTFQANLGSIFSLSNIPAADWNTYPLYLSIEIGNTTNSGVSSCAGTTNFNTNCGGDGVMNPYILLTSSPYAFNSSELGGLASSAYGQLAATPQTWTGQNIFQPTTNINGATVKQTSAASPSADIFDVQGTNGSTNFLQITSTAANSATVTLQSVGGTNALSLTSAGALTFTGAANSTWDLGAAHTLSLQTTNDGPITTGTGLFTAGGALTVNSGALTVTAGNLAFSGTTARSITGPSTGGLTVTVASGPLSLSTTTSGALSIDSATAVNVGTTNATSLAFGSTANNTATTFKQTASATAFQVQNASSNAVLTVDTSANEVSLGKASTLAGQLSFFNGTNSNTISLISGVSGSNLSFTLPTADGSGGQCLQTNGSAVLSFSACATGSGSTTLQNAYDNSSSPANITTSSASKDINIAAGVVPTSDIFTISNAGQGVTTSGVNALSVNFVGGAAAIESAGERIDLTPGTTSGGTWSGMRIVANGTGAVSGVTEYGLKIEGPTSPGAGTQTGLYIGTGWNTGLNVQSGGLNLAGYTSGGNPSDPPVPAANNLAVYAKLVSGRMLLKIKGPSGLDSPLQPALFGNNVVIFAPTSGATGTGSGFGTTWQSNGTVTHPTPATTSPAIANQIHRTRYANVVTTTNQVLGPKVNTADGNQFWTGNAAGLGGFFFQTRFIVELWPAATVRVFAGLSSSNTAVAASDTVAGDVVGLWHDTTDSATTFNLVTRNNVTTTKHAITVSNAIVAGNTYDWYMFCKPNDTTIYYRLDDLVNGVTYEGNTGTTLPRNTIFMGPQVEMSNGTANITVTTTAIGVNRIYIESDH